MKTTLWLVVLVFWVAVFAPLWLGWRALCWAGRQVEASAAGWLGR